MNKGQKTDKKIVELLRSTLYTHSAIAEMTGAKIGRVGYIARKYNLRRRANFKMASVASVREIKQQLADASAQLKGVEKDVSIQGSRWKLLDAGKDEFIKELKPFPKQKALIMYCGSLLSAPPEPFRLGMDAAEFLDGNPGAGWNATPPQGWFSCPVNGPFTFGGIMVLVSSASDDSVKRAATALSSVLNKLEISTSVQTIKPTDVGPNTFLGKMFGSESPWDLAIKDSTSFVLFIGPNSMHAWMSPAANRQKPPKGR